MLNIIIFGPPGAGKGTQSEFIKEKYNLTYISTGQVLRAEMASGTEIGLKVKDIIEHGGLASDEIVAEIIEKFIANHSDSNGFLFDGYPRTVRQAEILEDLFNTRWRSLWEKSAALHPSERQNASNKDSVTG